MTRPFRIDILEGAAFWLVARPLGPSGNVIYNDHVSEARCEVYEETRATTPGTALWSKTLTQDNAGIPAGCLQPSSEGVLTDAMWDRDSSGYSFFQPMIDGDTDDSAVALALKGGKVYRVEVELDADAASGSTYPELDDNGTIPMVWLVYVHPRASH